MENTWEPIDNLKSAAIRYYFVYYLLAYFAYVCGGWEGGAIIWIGDKTINDRNGLHKSGNIALVKQVLN